MRLAPAPPVGPPAPPAGPPAPPGHQARPPTQAARRTLAEPDMLTDDDSSEEELDDRRNDPSYNPKCRIPRVQTPWTSPRKRK